MDVAFEPDTLCSNMKQLLLFFLSEEVWRASCSRMATTFPRERMNSSCSRTVFVEDLSRCDARTRAWLRRQASEYTFFTFDVPMCLRNVCRTVIFKLHLPLQITNLIVIFLHLWVYYFQHFLISLSFTSCLSQVCEVWVFTNRKLKRSS